MASASPAARRQHSAAAAITTLSLGDILQRLALLAPQDIAALRILALDALTRRQREQLRAFPEDVKLYGQ